MTDKQIEAAQNTLPKWKNGQPPRYTPAQDLLNRELACRRMINSILCYNGKSGLLNNQYLQKYIINLGLETVDQLCYEQIEDFEKAKVVKDVYTDAEGLSYNSILWADS